MTKELAQARNLIEKLQREAVRAPPAGGSDGARVGAGHADVSEDEERRQDRLRQGRLALGQLSELMSGLVEQTREMPQACEGAQRPGGRPDASSGAGAAAAAQHGASPPTDAAAKAERAERVAIAARKEAAAAKAEVAASLVAMEAAKAEAAASKAAAADAVRAERVRSAKAVKQALSEVLSLQAPP